MPKKEAVFYLTESDRRLIMQLRQIATKGLRYTGESEKPLTNRKAAAEFWAYIDDPAGGTDFTDNKGKYSWIFADTSSSDTPSKAIAYGSGKYTDTSGVALEIAGNISVSQGTLVRLVPNEATGNYHFENGSVSSQICQATSDILACTSAGSPGSGSAQFCTNQANGWTVDSKSPTITVMNFTDFQIKNGSYFPVVPIGLSWVYMPSRCVDSTQESAT